jgi:hypothetical protein
MEVAMKPKTVESLVARKSADFESLSGRIINNPELLRQVFDGLKADPARIKYGCLKLLRIISEREPALLYPKIGRFFRLLDSDQTILKWGAIHIIGNLAAVDSKAKIDREVDHYLAPISQRVMITAANVIVGAGKIAQAKPYLADEIAHALLRVEHARYETDECRNVALGHVLQALDRFYDQLKETWPVVGFVNRQLSNSRKTVRRKAAIFEETLPGAKPSCPRSVVHPPTAN